MHLGGVKGGAKIGVHLTGMVTAIGRGDWVPVSKARSVGKVFKWGKEEPKRDLVP